MKTKFFRDEFKVGLLFVVGMSLLGIMLFRASQCRFTSGDRDVRIHFGYVGGLLKKAPVHMHGLEIGRVKAVELVGNKVEVVTSLRTKEPIREGYKIYIDILGLVGEKYIEILNGPIENPESKDNPLIGFDPLSVGHVLSRADEIADRTLKTIDFIQEFVSINEKKIQGGANELRDFALETRSMLKHTIDNLDVFLNRINSLTQTAQSDIGDTISNLKVLTKGLNSDREKVSFLIENTTDKLNRLIIDSSSAVDESVANFRELSADLRTSTTKASKHIESLNESLSSFISQLSVATVTGNQKLQNALDELNKSAVSLNETINRIEEIVSRVEKGQGSLGKLVTDEKGYQELNSTMAAGKRMIGEVNSITSNVYRKMEFFDNFGSSREYGLGYNHPSRTMDAQFRFSLFRLSPYFYMAGLSMREDNLSYDLQIGRRLGPLMARAGAINSKAGLGLDLWPFSKQLGISLEGTDISNKKPQLDLDIALRLMGDWYLTFGASDMIKSDRGFSLGLKAISGDKPTE